MLDIIIPAGELFDEEKGMFIQSKKDTELRLEHSLVSVSKWEATWKKPFLSEKEKSFDETIDYIRCMTITQNVDLSVYSFITNDLINRVNSYIDDSMSATWFSEASSKTVGGRRLKAVTNELIYFWMISYNIPFECQKWHFNRLITLIKVCEEENKPPKKLSNKEVLHRQAALNAARRKQLGSKG